MQNYVCLLFICFLMEWSCCWLVLRGVEHMAMCSKIFGIFSIFFPDQKPFISLADGGQQCVLLLILVYFFLNKITSTGSNVFEFIYLELVICWAFSIYIVGCSKRLSGTTLHPVTLPLMDTQSLENHLKTVLALLKYNWWPALVFVPLYSPITCLGSREFAHMCMFTCVRTFFRLQKI